MNNEFRHEVFELTEKKGLGFRLYHRESLIAGCAHGHNTRTGATKCALKFLKKYLKRLHAQKEKS